MVTQHLNAYGKYLSASYCVAFIISFVNIVILKETFTEKEKKKKKKWKQSKRKIHKFETHLTTNETKLTMSHRLKVMSHLNPLTHFMKDLQTNKQIKTWVKPTFSNTGLLFEVGRWWKLPICQTIFHQLLWELGSKT